MSASPLLTWLHLSDLRIGAPVQRSQWFQIQRCFLNDVAALTRTKKLDCIFITGGLTETGSAEAFYEFEQFMSKLLSAPELGRLPVFAVPGPTDAMRLERRSAELRALRTWFQDPDIQRTFLDEKEGEEYRSDIAKAFAPFQEWWNTEQQKGSPNWKQTPSNFKLPGEFLAQQRRSDFVAVGLNSAWLQPVFQSGSGGGLGPFEGGFDLCPKQLEVALAGRPSLIENTPSLLLSYHAPWALHKSSLERYQMNVNPPARRFAVHLCAMQGAVPKVEILRSGRTDDGIIFEGRALCDPLAANEPNVGYSIGEISGSSSLDVRIWPRRFHARRNTFTPDVDYDLVDGRLSFDLRGISESAPRYEDHPLSAPRAFEASASSESDVRYTRGVSLVPRGQRKPSRPSVRRLLREVLVTDSDLMAFMLDYHPDVYRRTSSGMDVTTKLNLLLMLVDTEELVQNLRRSEPTAFARHERLIDYE